jgi:hypothetical protein
MQRAVNAPPFRAAEVQFLPPRPILPAKRRKRRIPLVLGRVERKSPCRIHFLRTWRNRRRAGPRSRWAQAHEGATPSVRTSLSRRGWNGRHSGLKPRWTQGSVPVQPRPPRPLLRPCVECRPGGFKNRCADEARGRASRPGRTNLSTGGGTYTREPQKLVGESPCRCESCPVDQLYRFVL